MAEERGASALTGAPEEAPAPEAPTPPRAPTSAGPAGRRMRARLARMATKSQSENPVLEPLFNAIRANHAKADLELIEQGRSGHRQWVRRQFAPHLVDLDPTRRRVVVDALVCACDVYTWKLLRRDMVRSRAETESTMRQMVESLLRRA